MKQLLMLAALLIAGASLLAACGQQITGAEIVQHVRDTAANTTSAHFVVHVAGQVNGQAANSMLGGTHLTDMNGDVTLEVWYQKPNLLKAQILSTSQSKYTGAMIVHDGSYLWAYDPQSKIAYKLDTSALQSVAGQANIPADLQGMLANPDLPTAIDQVLALTDYTVGPNEKIGSYNTYRLDLKPKAGSAAAQLAPDAQATVWVDQASWVPVKITASASQGSGSLEMTTLELNPTLPADTFQFALPQGGHVVDLTGLTPRSMTLAEARQTAQAAGYTLLEPSYVPAGATLVQVMASRGLMGSGASTIMNYSGGSNAPTFWISELHGTAPLGKFGQSGPKLPDSGQTVTVRGVQGHYAANTAKDSNAPTAVLWWKELGSGLTIAIGGQLSQDEMLKIAAGLK